MQTTSDLRSTSKACTQCKEVKPLNRFGPDRRKVDGRKSECRPCASHEATKYYRRRKTEVIERSRWSKKKKLYGLSRQGYETLFCAQEGLCAICERPLEFTDKSTHVDHDHSTGVVRGLLCGSCNFLLGCAKDSVEVLQSARRYLERQI